MTLPPDFSPFLRPSKIIDWEHPEILALSRQLGAGGPTPELLVSRCFEWVRDEIRPSHDHGLQPVTCRASQVLIVGSGYCYAKSHLLAALLRAGDVLPAAESR